MRIIPGIVASKARNNNWHYLADSHSMSAINLNIFYLMHHRDFGTIIRLLTHPHKVHTLYSTLTQSKWFMYECAAVIFDRLMHFVYHYEILMNFCHWWICVFCIYAKLISGILFEWIQCGNQNMEYIVEQTITHTNKNNNDSSFNWFLFVENVAW